jgi:hypothetical protein
MGAFMAQHLKQCLGNRVACRCHQQYRWGGFPLKKRGDVQAQISPAFRRNTVKLAVFLKVIPASLPVNIIIKGLRFAFLLTLSQLFRRWPGRTGRLTRLVIIVPARGSLAAKEIVKGIGKGLGRFGKPSLAAGGSLDNCIDHIGHDCCNRNGSFNYIAKIEHLHS